MTVCIEKGESYFMTYFSTGNYKNLVLLTGLLIEVPAGMEIGVKPLLLVCRVLHTGKEVEHKNDMLGGE